MPILLGYFSTSELVIVVTLQDCFNTRCKWDEYGDDRGFKYKCI